MAGRVCLEWRLQLSLEVVELAQQLNKIDKLLEYQKPPGKRVYRIGFNACIHSQL
jgi:hypothetical protein